MVGFRELVRSFGLGPGGLVPPLRLLCLCVCPLPELDEGQPWWAEVRGSGQFAREFSALRGSGGPGTQEVQSWGCYVEVGRQQRATLAAGSSPQPTRMRGAAFRRQVSCPDTQVRGCPVGRGEH